MLGDADLLRQAFVNFVLNAIEAMGKNGVLTVRTALRSDHWFNDHGDDEAPCAHIEVTIGDTGRGIPESDLPRIFDPFFTTKGEGTGLGLSVSHGIIQEHGAIVDVDSAVGSGTTLRILFPLLESGALVDAVSPAVGGRA